MYVKVFRIYNNIYATYTQIQIHIYMCVNHRNYLLLTRITATRHGVNLSYHFWRHTNVQTREMTSPTVELVQPVCVFTCSWHFLLTRCILSMHSFRNRKDKCKTEWYDIEPSPQQDTGSGLFVRTGSMPSWVTTHLYVFVNNLLKLCNIFLSEW